MTDLNDNSSSDHIGNAAFGTPDPQGVTQPTRPRKKLVLAAGASALLAVLAGGLVAVGATGGSTADDRTSSPPPASSIVETVLPTTISPDTDSSTTATKTHIDQEFSDSSAPLPLSVQGPCEQYSQQVDLPIGLCDNGVTVREAQWMLQAWGATIDTDGYFGPATQQAVSDFQAVHALGVDGLVGAETWDALLQYVNTEPDGPDVAIDGVSQNVLYSCTNYPFQSSEGVYDGHVQVEQFLLASPVDASRTVLEIWLWDDTRHVVVMPLSSAAIGQATITDRTFHDVQVDTPTGPITVSSDVAAPGRSCNALIVTEPDGQSTSYGVIDVCNAEGYTVLTMNTWINGSSTAQSLSQLDYRASDDSIVDAVFVGGGHSTAVVDGTLDMGAKAIGVGGTLADDGSSFFVGINQFPEGGHTCVHGQITD